MSSRSPLRGRIPVRPLLRALRRTAALLVVLLAAARPAEAAAPPHTDLSGDVFDGNGGPLRANEVYHVLGSIHVPAGQTLSVEGGAIVKFGAADFMTVAGTLVTQGSAGQPAVFTSLRDDDHGGDSNADGPSDGSPGDWVSITFQSSSDASSFTGALVRYAGWSGHNAVQLLQADVSIIDTAVEKCFGAALHLATNSRPTVSGCRFDECSRPVWAAELAAIPGFSNNTATGNTLTNCIEAGANHLVADLGIGPQNLIDGALLLSDTVRVDAGTTLSLAAGTVLKFLLGNRHFFVDGTLLCPGTELAPVVVTSAADDDFGGDSNNDGPSDGQPGNWTRIRFGPDSDASDLRHTFFRYAGFAGFAGVGLEQADIHLEDCAVEGCFAVGFWLGNNSFPTVQRCRFDGNDLAISAVPWDALSGFECVTAADNLSGDHLRVTGGLVGAASTVRPDNYPGEVLVVDGSIDVNSGDVLTLEPGVQLKMANAAALLCSNGGELRLGGSAQDPVVITSIVDDGVGGDTNKDGTTTAPAPGQWHGLSLHSSSGPGWVRHATLRYPGWAGFSGLACNSPVVEIDAVRVRDGFGYGIDLRDLDGALTDCVVHGCGTGGIALFGGAFDVVHATVAGNTGGGIVKLGAFGGQIRNSIAWANGGGNFVGFTPGDLHYCNGDAATAGANGNLDVDPQFLDLAGGDLRLPLDSPCVERGDPADRPHGADIAGNPRHLDADLDRVQRVDIGAHEFGHLHLRAIPHGGASWTLDSSGTPSGPSFLFAGFATTEIPMNRFGNLFVDLSLPSLLLPWASVPSSVTLDLPAGLQGLRIHLQQLALYGGGAGNLSRLQTLDPRCDDLGG